jgi:hypothetical protein
VPIGLSWGHPDSANAIKAVPVTKDRLNHLLARGILMSYSFLLAVSHFQDKEGALPGDHAPTTSLHAPCAFY